MPKAKHNLPSNLWQVPIFLPYLQQPLTVPVLRAAEERLGLKLPSAYVEALNVQNGGYLHLAHHPEGSAVEILPGIGPHFPSVFDQVSKLQIGFGGDGHYFYVLDYRKCGPTNEPEVRYRDNAQDIDELIAPDFSTFLSELHAKEEPPVYALATHDEMATVVSIVSKEMGFDFEDRGSSANGFRLFFHRLCEHPYENVYLTSNRVRRGFVRSDSPRYAEVADLMPEQVLRYSELSDYGYFLVCTAEYGPWYDRFHEIVDAAGLPFEGRWVERHGVPD